MQAFRLSLSFFLCSLCFYSVFAQEINFPLQEEYQVRINKTDEKITIDGDLQEEVWSTADVASTFWYSFPTDGKKEEEDNRTEVRLAYNDQYIYIAATCYDTDDYVIQTLKRDSRIFWRGDAFAVIIDPVN
ncbi:MAG: sugar-binding protein, partial [Bacteroidota bacterium]